MVKSEAEVLDCPVWIMLINVVALEMLKAKLPPSLGLCCIDVLLMLPALCSLTNPPVSLQPDHRKGSCRPATVIGSRQMKIPTPYRQLNPRGPQERV